MRRAFSSITGSIVLLAIPLSANLAIAQRGAMMGGMGPGLPNPATVQKWTNTAVAPQQESFTAQSPADQAAEDRILAILKTPYSGNTHSTSLSAFLAEITRASGLPIRVDAKVLEEASIPLDAPVNCELPPVTLRSALDMILDPLDLNWVIQDECLLVTTPDKVSNQLITRVYPVLDLVAAGNPMNPEALNFQPLIQLFTDTIAPTTWDEVGGPGSIQQLNTSGSLVASQTREVHEQMALLLVALRQARNVQVTGVDGHRGRRHGSQRFHQREPAALAEPPRSVVTPTAAWSLPLVHE
jgi:hypothetical protein